MERNMLTPIIIGKAIEIHRQLGPGLLESAYRSCLSHELKQEGLQVETEKPLPVLYKGLKIDRGYRLDVLVENQVVVEIKRVEFLHEVHAAQILTYMKPGKYNTGLLINFNHKILKDGIRRFIF